MAKCAQPFCPGTIEDGYCNVCGMAAPRGGTRPVTRNGAAAHGSAHQRAPHQGPHQPPRPGPPSRPGAPAASPHNSSSGRTSGPASGRSRPRPRRTVPSLKTGVAARRGRLGAGLVEVPRVPYRDPATAVLQDPVVPEHKRTCGHCDAPVGHATQDRPEGRTEGFCPDCGSHFSFTPKLKPGERVGGQYEVLGCLAHGGLGWIYLARDHFLGGRWVVLKGLLNSGDADARSAAAAERQFLASVEHPAIVKIYNFVEHGDSGYIVMEYVGGRSLRDLVLEKRRSATQLSLPQSIAFALEGLRALGYLHDKNLLYCDFKPENIIQTEERIKLIDLGSVRWVGDEKSAIWGTIGYQAPEIATAGPSVSSDLYTVGRMLAVTTFDFTGFTGNYKHSLPPRDQVPVFDRHESFYRLVARATHADPAERFQSAAEMSDQLTWVLREVLAAEDGTPRPGKSTCFTPEAQVISRDTRPKVSEIARYLPRPLPDASAVYLAGLSSLTPHEILAALDQAPVQSEEVTLYRAQAHLDMGDIARAQQLLAPLEGDWRADWYLGLANLAKGNVASAREFFDWVYDILPGEPAVKLALAFCAEQEGDHEAATRYFKLVWRTDRSYLSAVFGLSRTHLAQGARATAVQALDSVPEGTVHRADAQLAAIQALVKGPNPQPVDAATRVEALELKEDHHYRLSAEILEVALESVRNRPGTGRRGTVFGVNLDEKDLGFALETIYRALAKTTGDRKERVALVERANSLRPRTLI